MSQKGNPRIAGTAPAGLGTTVDGRGGKTKGDVIVDGKGRVVRAREGTTTVATTLGIGIGQRVVVLVAGQDRGRDGGLEENEVSQ